jgi:hypothetical protein
MNRTPFVITTTLTAIALGLVACASVPPAEHAATARDCAALDAEMARTAEAQTAAKLQQQDAWKAVVPFAVAARYGQGMAAATESQQLMSALQAQATSLGCHGEGAASDAVGGGLNTATSGQGLRIPSFN